MGVQHLWKILEPARTQIPMHTLNKHVMCVDLSAWLYNGTQLTTLRELYTHPHVWVVLMRTLALMRIGVRPIMVVEGKACSLKHDTLARRFTNVQRQRETEREREKRRETEREREKRRETERERADYGWDSANFRYWCDDAVELLTALGIPCVQSTGEGEAMCAQLEGQFRLDGVVTSDCDAFLFGAQQVYRQLTFNKWEATVYSAKTVANQLGLDRQRLVALALLCGSDYTHGVKGIGPIRAQQFMQSLNGENPLDVFRKWRDTPLADSSKITAKKRKKDIVQRVQDLARQTNDFPSEDVINAYLSNDVMPSNNSSAESLPYEWSRPSIDAVVGLLAKNFQYPPSVSLAKLWPSLAAWDARNGNGDFRLAEIKGKKRMHKIDFYKVQWALATDSIDGTLASDDVRKALGDLTTLEPSTFVEEEFPDLVKRFAASKR